VRIFTRYILREVTGYALLGGVLFTFILFMRYLLPLMELTVRGVASPLDILRLIGYLLPGFLSFTIPMAVLIGILLGLSRLAADSEITAMRASGLGVLSFVRIVGIFAVAFWILGLANSLFLAPRAAQALLNYEDAAKTSQATVAIQPRVFYEDFKNYVLYAQDVIPGANGTAIWHHVFIADLTKPASPHIITATQATVLAGPSQTLRLELANGSRHDLSTTDPNQYDITTFASTELPMQTGQQEEGSHLTRLNTHNEAIPLTQLWRLAHTPGPAERAYLIELHNRFAYPTACLVLMLVGVPLGLSSKRGGKGAGFVATLGLVFVYYFLSSVGIAFARQGKLPPFLGVWGANLLFALAGFLLLQQISRGGAGVELFANLGQAFAKLFDRLRRNTAAGDQLRAHHLGDGAIMQRIRRALRIRFPLILDEYVMGSFLRNFALVLVSLTILFVIFTFFELIGSILRYRTPLVVVGDYLLNLVPFILNLVLPLCSLVAVLITFGALDRNSELTAMKATGISLYRIVAPMLVVATLLSGLLFVFDETYLPAANRRQEALLSEIKGKPAQTFLRPDRKWMSGQTGDNNQPTRIFYYQFFDPDRNVFANLTVFEFQPGTFNLTRRIFAQSARWDDNLNEWVLEDGWQRTFQGESTASFQPFAVSAFPEIHEQPSYFKKEDRQSEQMSYKELATYINDLKQSGFDTMRLRVQLNHKLAYPLMTLVLAILAIPFSLYAGKRGGIAGVGTAIGVAIAYWVIAGIFENLGDVNSLPPLLAAWSPDVLFAIAGTYLLLRTPT
jgi:LPS export ABC transporter permease LptG/LPS export ABC transporter permease LptF